MMTIPPNPKVHKQAYNPDDEDEDVDEDESNLPQGEADQNRDDIF
jgi:hypothetical protein